MFTLSQTGLEKAVGEGCLVINSRVCTRRILLFPSRVLVTDMGTTGLKQHVLIEKVLCVLMNLPVVFAQLQRFVSTTRQQLFLKARV